MLAYRRDLFEQLGIDAESLTTWDKFIAAGRRVTRPGARYMIMLPEVEQWGLQTVMYQRGADYFDAQGRLRMDDELAAQTLAWYVRLLAGPNRIASDPGFWTSAFYQALEKGYVLSCICPDWRSSMTEVNTRGMEKVPGNMALMPLPAFEEGGRRTSTWGGTMIGITRKCPNPDLAWELALHLYTDRQTLATIFRETNIIPPVRDVWDNPVYDEPRAYWSGQRIGRLYMALAPQVPRTYPSPFLPIAAAKLSEALSGCVSRYRDSGEEGFEEFVRKRLKESADYVRKQMERNPF
jgi:arabinosaccharide transport system substrate-binding protein